MKKIPQPKNTDHADEGSHAASPAEPDGESLPFIPGTEAARSLGDILRDAERKAASEQEQRNDKAPVRRNRKPGRSQARRSARERALQALYQWEVSDSQSSSVKQEFLDGQDMSRVDIEYFKLIFDGVSHNPDKFDALISPCLDRPIDNLDPIERAVLRIATYELNEHADVPARVVINEGIEITKRFGADKGHRYVNGVLDKLAASLRPLEMTSR